MARVLVVGGGFVGQSCALHLQRLGCKVTMIADSLAGSAQQASYGNCGLFARHANLPVNTPKIASKLPYMLADSNGPLAIKYTPHLLKMLPWGSRFLAACHPQRVEQVVHSLTQLLTQAEAGWQPAWEQAGVDIDRFKRPNGLLLLCGTENTFEKTLEDAKVRRMTCDVEILRPREIAELEPALSPCYAGGLLFDDWYTQDPGALVCELQKGFVAAGGEVLHDRAEAVLPDPGVRLQSGTSIFADEIVIAAGAHSAVLAHSAGDTIPLDTERGYHVTFSGQQDLISRPVGWAEGGCWMTPMAGRLRMGGTVELGGLAAPASETRYKMLEATAQKMLRNLPSRDRDGDWLGFRPTLPDALPVIGRSPANPSVIYAFGHQHLGWTLAGITGQLVAQTVSGATRSLDLRPFRAERFVEHFAGGRIQPWTFVSGARTSPG